MKKLSKEQQSLLDSHRKAVRIAHDDLVGATFAFNEAVTAAWDDYQAKRHQYLEAVGNAKEFVEGVNEAMDNYHAERSEKWQDSDEGRAYREWSDRWESIDLDPVDPDDPIEIDDPDEAILEALDELPAEPDQ